MKKFFLFILLPFIYWGCEKDFDTVVDSAQFEFQVINVSSFSQYIYAVGDSAITLSIRVNSSQNIRSFYADVYSSDKKKLNSSPVILYDDGNQQHGDAVKGDNIFSNKFPLSQSYPNGKYKIEYYVTNISGVTSPAAVHNFNYSNGQDNIAPIISNLIVDPDTLVVTTDDEIILLSVEAADSNGLNDIQNVYFIVTRPDGTSNRNQVQMFDSGNLTEHGDQIQGDGIFSLLIKIEPSNAKGIYRFEFEARDRGGLLSNTITHNILVQ
jgi:hypothetical protein